jgi:hypothetical protein
MWHWGTEKPPSLDGSQRQTIGLDTKIRIGKLVGPAHENTACRHTSSSADAVRRRDMAGSLTNIGTHEEYYRTAGYEVGVHVGSYVLSQFNHQRERMQAKTTRNTLLDPGQGLGNVLANLDRPYGLFISSCTSVMSRARLRDLVAFVGPILHRDCFPLLRNATLDASITTLTDQLQGEGDFWHWASGQLDDNNRPLDQSTKLQQLVHAVLRTLRSTGVTPTDLFEVAWISRRMVVASVRAACRDTPWLRFFSDGEHMATFACVTPCCLEIPGKLCHRPDHTTCSLRVGLSEFALSTRVSHTHCFLEERVTGHVGGNPKQRLTCTVHTLSTLLIRGWLRR